MLMLCGISVLNSLNNTTYNNINTLRYIQRTEQVTKQSKKDHPVLIYILQAIVWSNIKVILNSCFLPDQNTATRQNKTVYVNNHKTAIQTACIWTSIKVIERDLVLPYESLLTKETETVIFVASFACSSFVEGKFFLAFVLYKVKRYLRTCGGSVQNDD